MLPVCAPWAQAQLGMGSVPVRPASSSAAGAAASPARSHAPLLQTVAEREARRKHHQRLSRSCASAGDDILPSSSPACSSSATSSGGGGGGGGGGTRARGTTAAPPSSDLRSLRGVGPANEELLRQRSIHKLDDLADLYRRECGSDPGVLAKFLLSEVGIRRQHSDMIASALQHWAEQHAAESEAAAAGPAHVTLAVEGNISAGKSTFLKVLSHEQTALNGMLQVVQEPVSQWQSVECRDRNGALRRQNVLAKFYENPERYAYSFQHYVLISRMEQDRRTRDAKVPLRVLERSIFSDRQVFVRAMHKSGTMEDFEVSVYNQIFDEQIHADIGLVPDGFVYLRASPGTCMQRLKKRSRSEEVSISSDYLEMLHANHEDWLQHGRNLSEVHRESGGGLPNMSVLSPAPPGAAARFESEAPPREARTDWKVELINNVPDTIKDQVLLLTGEADLPQLKNRLALVMDHDRDVDMHNDAGAREEYAAKIKAFYSFVQDWKRREEEEMVRNGQLPQSQLEAIAKDAANLAVNAALRRRQLYGDSFLSSNGAWQQTSGGSRQPRPSTVTQCPVCGAEHKIGDPCSGGVSR
ncbi:deoxycytidine kinase [Micractinium conductrix]|uniref:Deoxycytidine kinase n=1 Tax=Micractinium conductrix TaxID=554055 RepID=A0A2P6VHP9_9CHLO|nr:deoxycytidine kinase [Micractinium conductrix]|eukprot:PSC73614.1 deoxycytidine kinase [Micractinium conductrix]